MAIGKPLRLRLFLEGIEVPVVAAQVSMGLNSPAAASIQIIPLDPGMRLHARTMVHLFFLNNISYDGVVTLENYRLLFSGEMAAFQVQQTPQSRGLVLQCVDFSSYWDSAHATAIEYGPGGNWATHTGAVAASNTTLFDDIVNQQANRLVQWLNSKPRTPGLSTISGLAGGIMRILEAVGGVPGVEKGVNDFFTIAQLRCRVLEQIVAEENDSTAARLMGGQVFDEWLRNGLQNMGQQVTFRDLIKLLFRYIYYEMVPNPAAKFVEADKKGPAVTKALPAKFLAKTTAGASIKADLDALIASITAALQERNDIQRDWNEAAKAQLAGVKKVLAKLRNIKASSKAARDELTSVTSDLTQAMSKLEALLRGRSQPTSWKEGFHNENFKPTYKELLEKAALTISTTQNVKVQSFSTTTDSVSQRLQTQIFRPDCWFAPAPVCNVVFPEQYASFNYDRNYIGEATRVLVQAYNTLVGRDALLSTKILAPNLEKGATALTKYVGNGSYRNLMPHEYHTGIVPRQEWLPNTSAGGASAPSEAAAEKMSGARLSWAQRIALFHFFKYRFAHRSVSVGGRFNPNIVCGFPGVLIRAPWMPNASGSLADILDKAETLKRPTHFIGMVGSLGHNIDQQGGTTTFTLHHARHHDGGDDEFLHVVKGTASVDLTVKLKLSYDEVSKIEDGAVKTAMLKYMALVTPQSASATSSTKTKKQKKAVSKNGQTVVQETTVSASPTPAFTDYAEFDNGKRRGLAPSPRSRQLGKAGPLKQGTLKEVEVPADRTARVKTKFGYVFQEVILTLVVPSKGDTTIPTELILRPQKWFSAKYGNEEVGKGIYQPFFGCDSIVDDLIVQTGDTSVETWGDPTDDVAPTVTGTQLTAVVEQLKSSSARKYTHSIERAIDSIAYLYGRVKEEGKDVESFIQQYTYRPIATHEDIFGSEGLRFSVDAAGKATPFFDNDGESQAIPRVGFHSQAIHEDLVTNPVKLAGLVEDITLRVPRMNMTGKEREALAVYDIRSAKREKVLAYYEALMETRAFRG